ncbi:hypothetical protein L228DRAFT_236083 [Xylona heveae TC161]|uniref:C2H2-type domain-containing protein n=1 Tax=Xylona heveae (strain CBS 132557 / TC161) TaxID=1328760 RepID=A0A165IHZ8_XYLHT|nr:hypothetical protein L228DRAFT_236083 [Xylona heveae TC161]KZF24926.1 hypothetical protein L228DRAFT_236083 [Xylona heveae TC161]
MDITNILNNKASGVPAEVEQQIQQQLAQAAQATGGSGNGGDPASETASEQAASPRTTEYARYAPPPRSSQPMHPMPNVPSDMPYHAQPMQAPVPVLQNGYNPDLVMPNGYPQPEVREAPRPFSSETPQKAFACSNCGKGFARRSDLARHERIHSGHRPHVCDYPGCKKQFIQRSALTVHSRVHTGEKPHRCERCGKPFSDSSSLARHRRIHSGKRPYMCPYADCLKTFTRRTTLTRHQNHHTGTVEEAAAARAAALATRPGGRAPGAPHSEQGSFSNTVSPHSTPSPGQRTTSVSPPGDLPPIPTLQRPHAEYTYMSNGPMPAAPLPPHLRGDLQQPMSRPASASLSSYGASQPRPSLTSHPSGYGPPPTLEPPPTADHRQPTSANGSPHATNMAWPSPTHAGLVTPTPGEPYVYPEPLYSASASHLYYPASNMRRPQSTEPEAYDPRARMQGEPSWAAPVS